MTISDLPTILRDIAEDQLLNAHRLALLDAAEVVRTTNQRLAEHAAKCPEFQSVYLFSIP